MTQLHLMHSSFVPAGGKKLSKAAKKRAREEVEREIRAAELARLQGDGAPGTAVEFERLALSSPNSSFVWIKYMAHLISLGERASGRPLAVLKNSKHSPYVPFATDVDKARLVTGCTPWLLSATAMRNRVPVSD